MAHADPLSLPQAREKLERAIQEFARCTLAAARYSGVISAYNPRDTDNLRAAEKAVDRAIDDLLVAASSPQKWVVVVPNGSWTKCYGGFQSYDACVEWVRANQWQPADVNIYPVAPPSSETPERS